MKHITYSTSVDEDVIKRYNLRNTDERQFDFYIMCYLNSPDGWSQDGYFFEPSPHGTIKIRLSSTTTVNKECGFSGEKLSCAILGGTEMYLNAERWFHGSKKSKLGLHDYRQYMVSHEMGHILGKEHVECPGEGRKAPIMLQQTRGIGKCIPNTDVKE
jgi:hypothetical protein